jgi:hypothetical protein
MLITVTRTIPGSKFAKADLAKGDPRKSYGFIASMLSRVSKSAKPRAPGYPEIWRAGGDHLRNGDFTIIIHPPFP